MFRDSEVELDPILSAKIVADLRSFDGFCEIAQEFMAEVPARILAIRQALVEKRFDVITLQAHALKGASGATGALRLNRVCGKLEKAARARSEMDVLAFVEDLVEESEIALAALVKEIENEPE